VLSGESAPAAVALRSRDISLHGRSRHRFWTYVPRDTSAASDEHPICQTYVDTCLLGCLERGGASLAARWVTTTNGWSDYWLNDAPMSRRPWLHRPRHAEIDAVLRQLAAHTRLDERRHPEDFSGRWAGCLRGLWGVPPRNPQFVGREAELAQTGATMARAGAGLGGSGCLTTLELVGMGGVGKPQLF
jgi:hypothetical protein